MKFFLKDLFKLVITLLIWYNLLNYFYRNKKFEFYEAAKYFPFHLVISIGYYAILSVCYKILIIKDCVKEHKELIEEIEEGREYYKKHNLKYY